MSARRVPRHGASRYGRLFWLSLVPGWTAIAFGLLSLWRHAGPAARTSFAVFFVGSAVVHDALVAPIALGVGSLVARRSPARSVVAGALFVTAAVTVAAWPVVRRLGAIDNPSFLPREAGIGLLMVLALVWAVAGIALWRRAGREA